MNKPIPNNSTSAKIIRTTITILPWSNLILNLLYLIYDNTTGKTLAFSNVLSFGYLIVIQWAIKEGHVSV
jgi:hypothetical protein